VSRPPTRPAWWPPAVAGLLLLLAACQLHRVLPAGPRLPLPEPLAAAPPDPTPMTTTTMQDGKVVAVDTAAAGLAAAAEAEPPQQIPADTAIRFATYDPLSGDDTLAHPHSYRRYAGTLNGRAIVVHLSVRANLRVLPYMEYEAGYWYYRAGRPAAEHRLVFRRRSGRQLVLAEAKPDHATAADTITTEWQLGWPLGRIAQARRRAVYGTKQQAVQLREDYSQATRYELLRLTAYGSYCHEEPGRAQPYFSTEFLHLLGPDSLRLAHWQAPAPAARCESLREQLLLDGSCQQVSQALGVALNDFNLFSYTIWTEGYYYGAHPEHGIEGFIVDLSTGQQLRMPQLLRPGTEPALLKLLARHLRHDYPEMNEDDQWHWKTVPPLPDSFTLTPTGLCADYGDYALAAYVSHYANTTTIPYAELRPLVRPGTPLAHMLAARGMW
jgi:hypothetical protein